MARVLLSKEDQYQLCLSARNQLEGSWAGLARHLKVHPHTFDNWYKCERLLPENIFLKLISICNFPIKQKKLLPDNWGQVKGGKKAWKIVWLRYGRRPINKHPGYGKNGESLAKKFPLPDFSVNLAEFIGIMLGDGGISDSQFTVTLGYSTDYEYAQYVIQLLYKLFSTRIGIYYLKNKDGIRIRVSGINLIKNLHTLGLVKGNKVKQQIDIPNWIQLNHDYIRSCIRGMVDTDGCVHRKVRRERNGTEYRSIGITFCSLSKPLQLSFIRLLNLVGFKASISGKTIYLCGKERVKRYVNEIGFSNPKHLNRYKNFLQSHGWVKVRNENCLIASATV